MPGRFIDNMSPNCDTVSTPVNLGDLAQDNQHPCVSETVDSIEYFSLKYSATHAATSESDAKTVVVMLTSDDDAEDQAKNQIKINPKEIEVVYSDESTADEIEYGVQDMLSLLHFLHLDGKNPDEDIIR